MSIRIQQILDKIIPNPKKLFLIDSLGAFLTAFFLGVLLVELEEIFGMPKQVLYYLSLIAICFGMYSILCHFFLKKNWSPYLKIIIIVNLMYGCVTVGLVGYFYQRLTILGLTYFTLEIMVMITLIVIEVLILYKRANKNG